MVDDSHYLLPLKTAFSKKFCMVAFCITEFVAFYYIAKTFVLQKLLQSTIL